MSAQQPELMIGVDIGGTFTDCVVMDADGQIVTGKSPTTPDDRSQGFFDAIERAAEAMGTDLESLLRTCRRLVHGTTTGTNAIVERRGARVGLLATKGHEEAMFLMKGTGRTAGLSSDQALDVPNTYKPDPLVPRELIRPVTERMASRARSSCRSTRTTSGAPSESWSTTGVEALTISFLWSAANSAHEHRARELALRGRARPLRLVRLGPQLEDGRVRAHDDRRHELLHRPADGRLRRPHPAGCAAARVRRDGAVRAVRGRRDHQRGGASARRSAPCSPAPSRARSPRT